MKALVITASSTSVPSTLAKHIAALGIKNCVFATPVSSKLTTVSDILRTEEPDVVLIDGHFAPGDADKFGVIGNSGTEHIVANVHERSALAPESLLVLNLVRLFAERGTLVVFYLDEPSNEMTAALKRIGADIVWKTLTQPTEVEANFINLLLSGKDALKSTGRLVSALFDRIVK